MFVPEGGDALIDGMLHPESIVHLLSIFPPQLGRSDPRCSKHLLVSSHPDPRKLLSLCVFVLREMWCILTSHSALWIGLCSHWGPHTGHWHFEHLHTGNECWSPI